MALDDAEQTIWMTSGVSAFNGLMSHARRPRWGSHHLGRFRACTALSAPRVRPQRVPGATGAGTGASGALMV